MELSEVLDKAKQILEEERSAPTVRYVKRDSEGLASAEAVISSQELQATSGMGTQILEGSHGCLFESVNYNLLSALHVQIPDNDRTSFVRNLVLLMHVAPACGRAIGRIEFPSELPLIGEFAVRNGGKEDFFAAISEAQPLPGHVTLLRHLQDLIVLNYRLFSDVEYQTLAQSVAQMLSKARAKVPTGARAIPAEIFPVIGKIHPTMYCQRVGNAASAIQELCRKARYLYLKGALLEGLNLEANQDKDAVGSYLTGLGFTDTLMGSLNEAERLYHGPATAFELKSSMGHLRSFLENLQAEAIPAIVEKGVPAPTPGWGSGLTFLRQNNVLTLKEEQFAASLYSLISDEAVHPLIAEREYARLARNIVIEYALLFLRKMDKLGLKRP